MSHHSHEGCHDEVENFICPDNAALVVVDVQEKLWPHMAEKTECLASILKAIEVAGHLEMPIFVTEQYVKGLGNTISEVQTALKRFDCYHPIEKQAFSCLGENRFIDAIEERGVETIAIVGIEAHICVMQTALEFIDTGMDVFFIAEGCASRNPRHKDEAVQRVRDAGAIVGSVEMFAFEMMRTAAHPAFKKVQKVIL